MAKDVEAALRKLVAKQSIAIERVEVRTFPGERWFVVYVPSSLLAKAQAIAGSLEAQLAIEARRPDEVQVVAFRPHHLDSAADDLSGRGRLFAANVDQLVQLLEARSRTSDALPSLKYVTDPRASLAAVRASRHHLIFGRRGVGKTALLLETKNWATKEGHAATWLNAHVLKALEPAVAAITVAQAMLTSVLETLGTSAAPQVGELADLVSALRSVKKAGLTKESLGTRSPEINNVLRRSLREGLVRLYVFIDDFYLVPIEHQAYLLDFLAGLLRDSNGWLKVASIERLSRVYEPSANLGLEVPHDASRMDLDVTLEDPAAAQGFLEAVLQNYLEACGIPTARKIAKREALGRLVLASGGVPRDYLSLLANSIVGAREARKDSREIGKEDVARAAGLASRVKKRDLEQDVGSLTAAGLLRGLESVTSQVRGKGFTYFRVDTRQVGGDGYQVLARLADLRFLHLVQQGLSDQHKADVKYEAYVLDLSEYTNFRLKRNLQILDLEEGTWTWRLTGEARKRVALSGTNLRDLLRRAPIVDMKDLESVG